MLLPVSRVMVWYWVGSVELPFGCGHTMANAPYPIPNCEAKCHWVSIVVAWGTSCEQDDAATILLFFFLHMSFTGFTS